MVGFIVYFSVGVNPERNGCFNLYLGCPVVKYLGKKIVLSEKSGR